MSESLYREWAALLISIGQTKEAVSVLSGALTASPGSLSLLEMLFQVQVLATVPILGHEKKPKLLNDTVLSLGELLGAAMAQAGELPALMPIWCLLKSYFLMSDSPFDLVLKYLQKLIVLGSPDIHEIKSDALQLAIICYGLEAGRQLFLE